MKPPVIIAIVIIVIIIIGGAWYAYSNPAIAAMLGLRHTPTQSTTASTTSNGYHGFSGQQGGFAMGSIETLNGNAFTITLSDGTTKNINITGTTFGEPITNTCSPTES